MNETPVAFPTEGGRWVLQNGTFAKQDDNVAPAEAAPAAPPAAAPAQGE